MIKRRTPLKRTPLPRRTAYLPRQTTPIPKRGPRKVRREASYKKFLASAAWKKIRAAKLALTPECEFRFPALCVLTEQLTVDHKTYARFGGKERMSDLRTACRPCHNHHHALEGKSIR